MSESIVTAVFALIGVALGGFLESRRSNAAFQREQRSAYFEREAIVIRELFEVITAHRRAYGIAIAASVGALRGAPSGVLTDEKIPWERLKMLAGLHAPELIAHVSKFDETASYVGQLMLLARTGANLTENAKQDIIDKLATVYKSFDVIYDGLEGKLLERSEQLRTAVREDAGMLPR